jgi:hypothetical protein
MIRDEIQKNLEEKEERLKVLKKLGLALVDAMHKTRYVLTSQFCGSSETCI